MKKVSQKIRCKETKAGVHHFPIIYIEEIHQDPFHLSFRPPNNLEGGNEGVSDFQAKIFVYRFPELYVYKTKFSDPKIP